MKLSLRLYVALCILAGVAGLTRVAYVLSSAPEGPRSVDAVSLMVLTFLGILSELKPVRFYFGSDTGSEVTLGIVVFLSTLMLFGWPFAVIVVVLASTATDLHAGKHWYKTAFNACAYTLATWLGGEVYELVVGGRQLAEALLLGVLGGALAGLTFFVVNTGLVGIVLSLAAGSPIWQTVLKNGRLVAPVFVTMVGLAVIAAVLWTLHPLAVMLLVPAMVATKLSYANYIHLRTETDNFLRSLADAIDLRDPSTAEHSKRVSELAKALGERLELSAAEVAQLEAIARVHDVGKIAVRDAVLLKPSGLSRDEFDEMKEHVEAGARILGHISLYRNALDILCQHHERLDGSGYPRGLRGDEIIFPARVLAVADAYDAMTTDRPYRPAKTPEEAVRELYRVAGKEYDLNVVRALEDELIARGVLKGPVVPAALEAARQEAEAEAHAAARTPRVVPLPRVGSGRNPS
jgi:HD-GYP domain-containing protein (c-di-GMP phosphodiesterase class II)